MNERTNERTNERMNEWWVPHTAPNPARQGLTFVPLLNRVSQGLLRDTYFYFNLTHIVQ